MTNEQLFQITLGILGLLLTIIGSSCSFILYSIYQRLTGMEEKIISTLSKVERLDEKSVSHANQILDLEANMKSKCDFKFCLLKERG